MTENNMIENIMTDKFEMYYNDTAGERLMQKLSAGFRGKITENAAMSELTSWRIGGAADWLVEPCDAADVVAVLKFCAGHDIPLTVIGRGTNLLVSDKGIAGVVMRIGEAFGASDSIEYIDGDRVKVGAGVLLAALSRESAAKGYSGLEWACGIPGNIGGALMMNAGAYGSSIGEMVTEVEVAAYNTAEKTDAGVRRLSRAELNFGYRSGCLDGLAPLSAVALSATLQLHPGDSEASLAKIRETLAARAKSQPLEYPSAGSVFRNPEGSHAGYLSEQAGCKGMAVGGAKVSEKHGNFIINTGGATAADVLALIERVQAVVAEKCGYQLVPEVRLLGRRG